MIEIIYNIVPGNLFPVLTNPSIYYPFAYYGGIFFAPPSPESGVITKLFDQNSTVENCLLSVDY
jgi:hypothetical protein